MAACIRARGRTAPVERHLAIVDALLVASLATKPSRGPSPATDNPTCSESVSVSAAARAKVRPVIDGDMSVLPCLAKAVFPCPRSLGP